MYKYSAVGQARLKETHPDLQKIFNELILWVDAVIFCGHRGEADQNKAFADGASKLQWPNSKHNSVPSMAVDAGPYFVEIKNTDWKDRLAFARLCGRVDQIADQLLKAGEISHVVVWGGDWDDDGSSTDHKFLDLPHFELKKLPD
jgi:peptidoglycan L-alanyl-D-glutamate endopeptidase CwlK